MCFNSTTVNLLPLYGFITLLVISMVSARVSAAKLPSTRDCDRKQDNGIRINASGMCEQCPACGVGHGIKGFCEYGKNEGSQLCVPCIRGASYNNIPGGHRCYECTNCTSELNRLFHIQCQPDSNAECTICLPGHDNSYHNAIDKKDMYTYPCTPYEINPSSDKNGITWNNKTSPETLDEVKPLPLPAIQEENNSHAIALWVVVPAVITAALVLVTGLAIYQRWIKKGTLEPPADPKPEDEDEPLVPDEPNHASNQVSMEDLDPTNHTPMNRETPKGATSNNDETRILMETSKQDTKEESDEDGSVLQVKDNIRSNNTEVHDDTAKLYDEPQIDRSKVMPNVGHTVDAQVQYYVHQGQKEHVQHLKATPSLHDGDPSLNSGPYSVGSSIGQPPGHSACIRQRAQQQPPSENQPVITLASHTGDDSSPSTITDVDCVQRVTGGASNVALVQPVSRQMTPPDSVLQNETHRKRRYNEDGDDKPGADR